MLIAIGFYCWSMCGVLVGGDVEGYLDVVGFFLAGVGLFGHDGQGN